MTECETSRISYVPIGQYYYYYYYYYYRLQSDTRS